MLYANVHGVRTDIFSLIGDEKTTGPSASHWSTIQRLHKGLGMTTNMVSAAGLVGDLFGVGDFKTSRVDVDEYTCVEGIIIACAPAP